MVALETPGEKPRFAAMHLIPRVSGQEIQALVQERLVAEVMVETDGRQESLPGYLALPSREARARFWQRGAAGPPWGPHLDHNIKGNIHGVHHGVSPKHLPRYIAEFCYRFTRRLWEPQMFNRILHAFWNASSLTFSELGR